MHDIYPPSGGWDEGRDPEKELKEAQNKAKKEDENEASIIVEVRNAKSTLTGPGPSGPGCNSMSTNLGRPSLNSTSTNLSNTPCVTLNNSVLY